ncbi:MAG: Wzz/FepE/Etk N-terminal domain-containing protein [Sulfurospirillum sp.]
MQNTNQNTNCIEEDEIDLRELFATIWGNKFKIIIFTFVITSLTLIYVLRLPNSYRSSVVLAPQEQSKGASLGGLSALAGMAGINLGGSSMDAYNSMKTILDNDAFEEMIIKKYNLDKKLTPEYMDKNLVFAFGYRGIYDLFKSKAKKDKSKDEIIYNTIKRLKKIVSLSSDKKSGAITLSVELQDRFLAEKLLEIYLNETTNYLRKLDMQDISKKLKYYKNELSNISDIELKTQISQLISSLIQKKVLSSASEYYNVRLMTKPYVPFIKDKSKPKRALILIVAFITSIILAIFGVFFIEFLRNEKEETKG